MDRKILIPQPRRRTILIMGSLVLSFVSLYLFLLIEERISAWQAASILDRLEILQLGDRAADFERAVQDCHLEKTGSTLTCVMHAGAFRYSYPWKLVSKLPDDWAYRLSKLLSQAGLRYWRLVASASISDAQVKSVSVGVFVVGRYESLGAGWNLSANLPDRYRNLNLNPDQRRTYLNWFNITSIPGGEGLEIHATGASTNRELRARRVNHKCLFSFRGCDGLCELLPDAVAVLKERNSTWGGSTGAPRSKCDWN